ncbi:MAG: M20/M25/M40 family metallo-hydrolase [bacterium]|nr:M20/M25/M40 family metallo-hydrolase [bacterium]
MRRAPPTGGRRTTPSGSLGLPSALALAGLLLFPSCAQKSHAAPPEALAWFVGYLKLDTTNPPGREEAAAQYLREILHREGIPTRLLVTPSGRTSLYARLEAATPTPGAGALVLTHHMDVVPPGPGWSQEPFSGLEENGWIWGRGAVDAKSLGIAQLAAFIDLHRRGGPQTRPVVYLAVADEERGGSQGTGWLIRHHPEMFADTAAVLGEGGANRVIAGRHFWWGIETAQKRPLWLKATSYGRGGHGSMLNPGSAPHQLTLGLARLLQRPRDFRVTPEARRYLEAVKPYQSDFFGRMVAELDDIVKDEKPNERLFPGVANYLLDTIQVNVIETGERINVVPKKAEARIDIRLLPDADEKAMLEEIRELLGDYVEVEVLLSSSRAEASPLDNEIYRCLELLLGQSAPVVPAFIPGVTDARYFRERGIPAYGFSPFALAAEETGGIHSVDERITRGAFLKGLAVYSDVVTACTDS